jgi:four helix bundle protein
MGNYGFEKLIVWQRSAELSELVYELAKKLPKDERFALIDQLKRAATSVSLNIAEGSAGQNKKVFYNFLCIAQRSLYETIAILKLIERLFKVDVSKELEKCDLINKPLSGLKNFLVKDQKPIT